MKVTARRDIQKQIKMLMQAKHLSCREIGETMGCTAQAVWRKLNEGESPKVETVRRILLAIGYELHFSEKGRESEMEARRDGILEAAGHSRVQYGDLYDIFTAMGIEITIQSKI